MSHAITCQVCSTQVPDYLGDHLLEVHSLTADKYLSRFPEAPTVSQRLLDLIGKESSPRRKTAPTVEQLYRVFDDDLKFAINPDVPASACLPLPPNFRWPTVGHAKADFSHVAVALACRRHTYLWGGCGTGKDAIFHGVSALCRWPAEAYSIQPKSNIRPWFYTRRVGLKDQDFVVGPLFRQLTEGYRVLDADGKLVRTIPYMILLSDLDRATRDQLEMLRMILDSTKGRVAGPDGQMHDVLPGTLIVATGNTSGSGDPRGRMVSAQVMDASMLDRLMRVFRIRPMDWADEVIIVKANHPYLAARCPQVFDVMGKVTEGLRKAIHEDELYADFSMRGLEKVLGHAEDQLQVRPNNKVPKTLIKRSIRAWLDGLDEVNRDCAKEIIEPLVKGGIRDEGDTSHIDPVGKVDTRW